MDKWRHYSSFLAGLVLVVGALAWIVVPSAAFAQGPPAQKPGNQFEEILAAIANLQGDVGTLQTTVDNLPTSTSQVVLQETFDLGGFPGNSSPPANHLPLMDVTGVGRIAVGHFTAVLPNENAGCTEDESPFDGLVVAIGSLTGGLNQIQSATNVGIAAAPSLDFDGAAGIESVCFFHATFDVSDATVAGEITDILFINRAADLPPGSSITVTVRLE